MTSHWKYKKPGVWLPGWYPADHSQCLCTHSACSQCLYTHSACCKFCFVCIHLFVSVVFLLTVVFGFGFFEGVCQDKTTFQRVSREGCRYLRSYCLHCFEESLRRQTHESPGSLSQAHQVNVLLVLVFGRIPSFWIPCQNFPRAGNRWLLLREAESSSDYSSMIVENFNTDFKQFYFISRLSSTGQMLF